MAYEMKPGEGSAFLNEKKEDWHADFRGKVVLPDGKTHYLDVYKKTDRNGNPFVRMKIGKEVAGRTESAPKVKDNGSVNTMKDDIPW
jgi:hypothetical protein